MLKIGVAKPNSEGEPRRRTPRRGESSPQMRMSASSPDPTPPKSDDGATLVALVDTASDKHLAAGAYAALLALAAGDRAKLDAALHTGDPSPRDLFALGEIAAGERMAALALEGREPRRDPDTNPFDERPTIHLSTPRLELYLRGDRATLGPNVYERIRQHLRDCGPCAKAADAIRWPRAG